MSTPGKRKAVKPSRSARTLPRRTQTPAPHTGSKPSPAPAPVSKPSPAPAPVSKPSPAPAPVSKPRPAPHTGPQPSAAPHTGGRRNVFPLLPSAPTAVGAAALVIAATGAVTFTHSTDEVAAASSATAFRPASALTGTSAETSRLDLDSRSQAVSRDSERAALQDAAHEKLQQAAEAQAQQRNAALAQLAASAEKYAGEIAANAWHLPVAAGVYHLTAGFGESSGLWSHLHTGLDFAAPTGTPVMAVANGTITSAGWAGAYGNRLVVTHEDGTETWYCHLSAFKASVGQTVVGGQEIGLVGATGNVTGPHLHLEVRPGAGDPVDPFAALLAHGLHP